MGYQAASVMVLWLAQALFGVVTMDSGRTRNHGDYVCSTWGKYHFKTFDGDYYEFPGNCTYNFASHCGGSYSEFSVHIQRSTVIDKILITIKDINIELRTNIAVVAGSIAITPYYRDGIVITKSVAYFKVYTKTGFTLMWNKGDAVLVELDPIYNNYTCGLCGDYNGISEFSVEDRKLSPIQFGNLQNIHDPKETCTDLDETKAIIDTSSCSEYRSVCEYHLRDAAFAECEGFLDVEVYINACMLDMCSCSQSPESSCLCSTISEFSRQCSHAGGHPGNWRTLNFCHIQCPNNMIYQESSSPCMNTCSHLDSNQVCLEHYIDDCFCPEGTVQDDYTEQGCVPVSECHCKYQERLYLPGEIITNDCNKCHCISGRWKCTDHTCPGPCSIEGGAHITTFDGKSYTFHGDCHYVLSKGIKNSSHVILGEITRISDLETSLKSISVLMDNMKNVVTFKTDGTVLLNDQRVTPPQVTASFSISQPTDFYIILNTVFGLQMQIQLQPMMQLYITMDESSKGKLQGLCGNFNYKEIDDFQISGGLVEATASAFANTWKATAMCSDVSDRLDDPCSQSIENKKYADYWCSFLEGDKSPFAKCHSTINPARYAKRCRYDSCSCKESEKCMCAALSSYVTACAEKGIIMWGWRKGICDKYISCPSSQIYLYNLTTCQPTCRSLAEGEKPCASGFTAVDGCGCPDGEFLNEKDQCVPISQCTCYTDGSYVNPLESINKLNELCTCHDGKLVCSSSVTKVCSEGKVYYDCNNQTNPPNQRSCKTLAINNFPTACLSGCVCPNGLLDDGAGGCVPEEDCPCSYKQDIHPSGTKINEDCNTCFCRSGQWTCTKNVCYRTCSIYGSGHYITFDEKLYDFDGNCEFVAATDYCGPNHSTGTFSIVTENVPCGTTGVTCSRSIKAFLGNETLILANEKLVDKTASEGAKSVSYLTREVGLYLVIQAMHGILLIWDKKTTIFIKISPDHKGKLCGLCGNFDDNSQNDFMAKNMLPVVNVLEFGNSWKSDSACPDATAMINPCLKNPHRQAWAEKQCGLIKSDVFKICQSKVDPLPFYEACVSDACACDSGGDCECFCTAVAAYAQECTKAGACVYWRTPDICPIFCDYYNPKDKCEWHYHPCGNNTMKTCRSINNVYTNVSITYLEGCYPTCPQDKPIYDEIKRICVPPELCGCFINNTHYDIEEQIPNYKRCHNCSCTAKGNVKCTVKDDPDYFGELGSGELGSGELGSGYQGHGHCIVKKCVNGSEIPRYSICSTSSPTTTSVTSTTSTTVTTTTVSTTTGTTASPWTLTSPTSTPCVYEKVCWWTEWFDVNKPKDGLESGDYETYEEIKNNKYNICDVPEQIDCRAVNDPDISLKDLKQNVHCNVSNGLICKNSEQDPSNSLWQKCFNYKIRVECCDFKCFKPPPYSTTTTTTNPTTTTETTPVTTTTPITTTSPTTTSTTTTPTTTTETTPVTTTTPITTTPPTTTTTTSTPTTTTETTPVTTTTPITTTSPTTTIMTTTPTTTTETTPVTTTTPITTTSPTTTTTTTTPTTTTETTPVTTTTPITTTSPTTTTITSTPTTTTETTPVTTTTPITTTAPTTTTMTATPTTTTETTPVTTTTPITTTSPTTTMTATPTTTTETTPVTTTTFITTTSPTTTVTATPTTTTETTPVTTTTFITTTVPICKKCGWSRWFDVSSPALEPNGGDFETYVNIRNAGYDVCEKPEQIACRSIRSPNSSLESNGQYVTCNVSSGLICQNNDQTGDLHLCFDYEISVYCCQVEDDCISTPETTPITTSLSASPSTTSSCAPVCLWSWWFDVSYPNSNPDGGDFETYKDIRKAGYQVCERPQNISCRSTERPDTPLKELGQNVTCDVSYGLVCYKNHPVFPCLNFEIQVYCCQQPANCVEPTISTTPFTSTTLTTTPSTTTVMETTTSTELTTTSEVTTSTTPFPSTTLTTTPSTTTATETTTSTELTTTSEITTPFTSTILTTTPLTTTVTQTTTLTSSTTSSCAPVCLWSPWFDVSYPNSNPDGGDFETYKDISKAGYQVCERPQNISCRSTERPDTPLKDLGQNVTCDVSYGLVCYKNHPVFPCLNFEIQVYCCQQPANCVEPPISTTPFTSTTLTTTPSTTTVMETTTSTELTTTSELTTPFTSTTLTTTPSTTTVTETTTSTELTTTSEVTTSTTPFPSTTLTTMPSTTTVMETTTSTELTTTSEVTTPFTSTTLTTTSLTTTVPETTTSTELTTTSEVTTPFTSTILTTTPSTTTVTETTTSTELTTTSEVTTPFTSTTLTTMPSTTTVTETTTSTELTTTSEVTTPFTSTTLTTMPSTTTVTETTTSTELTTTSEVTTPFTSTTLTTTSLTTTVPETTTSTELTTTSEVTTPFTSTTLTTMPSTTTVTETTTSTELTTTSEVTTPFTSTILTTTPSTTTVTQTTTLTSSTAMEHVVIITPTTTTRSPGHQKVPTTTSTTITSVNTTTPESITTSATPCVCVYNGVTYPKGEIKSGAVGELCYKIVCSETCTTEPHSWVCETATPTSTTSTPASSTTTTTSQSTTAPKFTSPETNSTIKQSTHITVTSSTVLTPPPDCLLVPPRKYNETWKIDNCTVGRCLGGTSVSITSITCKPQPPITCVNGFPPIAVTDDDQCCQHWECQCPCFGWGDPHFYTFDGTSYDFQGTCTYTLVEQIIKKISIFGVYIDNFDCGSKDRVSCPRDIIVKYENQTIRLKKTFQPEQSVQVTINDAVVGIPYANNGVKVYASGINYVVEIPSIQSFIKHDGFKFEIHLPYHLFGNNTQGHCGTCTNNRSDDCLTKSGNYVSKCEDMASTWLFNDTKKPNCVPATTTTTVPPNVTHSTTTTTCSPSTTCQIINDEIFRECHKVYPPELYYKSCIFDSCHASNMECSSLEQYAQLCAGQGICIPWRDKASTCKFTCPSDKVYNGCGPVNQRTCQTTPEQYAAMQNNSRFIEGCFCPKGTMRHSEAVDICVPSCGCVGPDNVPRQFGENFRLGCLDCVCREGGSGLYCDKHECPVTNAICEQAGFIPVTRINSNDPCCNETVCICDPNQCPMKPSCRIGYEAVGVIANGSCCTSYNCVPKKVCVHEKAEYMPGAKVFLDKCKNCVCSNSRKGSGAEIECTDVPCNKQCPQGYELVNSTSDCCGDCKQTHCVINDKAGLILLQPGASRKSEYDSCTVYDCTVIKGQFSRSVSQTPCPYFNEDNCIPGTIELSPNGCCKKCIETSPSCKLHQKLEYLSHNNCQSEDMVNITYCEGPCNTLSIYSAAASKMSHNCTCCQEVKTRERIVPMKCSHGRQEELVYVMVEECNCVSTDCESSQSQKAFTTARARPTTRGRKRGSSEEAIN